MTNMTAAQLNFEMWLAYEKDVMKLQEQLLEERYEEAHSCLSAMEQTARRNSDELGNGESVIGPALHYSDERRLLWNKVSQKTRQLLRLLEDMEYGRAEECLDSFLNDVRLHTQAAIEEYNHEKNKTSS